MIRLLVDPFRFVLIAVSGWMNGRQLLLIDYLREENRVLREQLLSLALSSDGPAGLKPGSSPAQAEAG